MSASRRSLSPLHHLRSLRLHSSYHLPFRCHLLHKMFLSFLPLRQLGFSVDNSQLAALTADNDPEDAQVPKRHVPRNFTKAHFSYVCPQPVSSPRLLHASPSVARLIGLDPSELDTKAFVNAFSGNEKLPGLDTAYCTLYGSFSYGHWLGQFGDGRAISLGEVMSPLDNNRYELQLKGAGRTPFSRGFDGRAVLRSSVREHLASEAMHCLGILTTRSLSIISTDDKVTRKWYSDSQYSENSSIAKFGPDKVIKETVAIQCRVSSSFFRLSHLEILARRKESKLLVDLADHIIAREFPELKDVHSKPERYVFMFEESMRRNIQLVTNWTRVGYCQGNMNSDNIHISGKTLDYGPFGWMETFSPDFQPFTSDTTGNFCFGNQYNAMLVSLQTFADSVQELVKAACKEEPGIYSDLDAVRYCDQVQNISMQASDYCSHCHEKMITGKLGLGFFDERVKKLWRDFEALMHLSAADYTMTCRSMCNVIEKSSAPEQCVHFIKHALQSEDILQKPLNSSVKHQFSFGTVGTLEDGWVNWFRAYLECCKKDGMSRQNRLSTMKSNNPKYILRNWMAAMAYERAEKGDPSLVEEISALLQNPYDNGDEVSARKWYSKAPVWASNKPGVSFMSCSS